MLKVLCVDDNLTLNALLELSIEAEGDMLSVGILHSADSLVKEAQERRPDVVVLDLCMPGRDPLLALKEMSAACPEVKTVVYSASGSESLVESAVEAGAWGYVSKDGDPNLVITAVREVAAGRFFMS